MSESCTVLIAAPDLLPSLKLRTADINGELLAFSDADALRAFEMIIRRRPGVIALERLFAATPRGAALIKRIKSDPTLAHSEIRVVSHDSEYSRVSPRKPSDAAPDQSSAAAALTGGVPTLDQRGTRRARRFMVSANVDVLVDGNTTGLVDLSTVGAQVMSPCVLKPNQRVRMALTDERGILRFNATVAWAKFEIPPGKGPCYRAGLDFVDADGASVDAFCARHKA